MIRDAPAPLHAELAPRELVGVVHQLELPRVHVDHRADEQVLQGHGGVLAAAQEQLLALEVVLG